MLFRSAFRKALRAANFASVRGSFKFNVNQYPIQNYYLRVIGRDKQGRIANKTLKVILTDYHDPFAPACKMQ